MGKYIIKGGKPLHGSVTVSGAKNAAVAIIPAAILVDGTCRIENIPGISDVKLILKILEKMGAAVKYIDETTVDVDCSAMTITATPGALCRKMRASYYILGALLGRFGRAQVDLPGGCNFGGARPIDQHIKGFEALGASVKVEYGMVTANAQELKGTEIYLDVVSVGATINIILAACKAKGTTVIENAAREPHIVDLANYLNSMGADVRGAGTDVIKIRGVEQLHGCTYSIIPDQIEAGTYMVAAAAAGGEVVINNVIPKHLDSIISKLEECGIGVIEEDESVKIISKGGRPECCRVKTMPHPGFPTDMQPQITAMLSVCNDTSYVIESVWDNRFKYVEQLRRMGANITVAGKNATVTGVPELNGAPVEVDDLRAGAAMVIAGLMAKGTTTVTNIKLVDRGYENLVEKLRAVGADIVREEYEED